MSHDIHHVLGISRRSRDLKAALAPYFKPDLYDLSFSRILPPPKDLTGETLAAWKREHWIGCPFTFDGRIKRNRLHFTTINAIPFRLFEELSRRLGVYLIVTTSSGDDLMWTKMEYRPDGLSRIIYWADANGEVKVKGNVPVELQEMLEYLNSCNDEPSPCPSVSNYEDSGTAQPVHEQSEALV